ncbi:MAG: hypothetical protein VKP63_00605 [Cyanobacteriota bacterium]|nr:hypothetical protein [Cyanobacteriota bacterium]
MEALGLPEEPENLRQLQERWAAGDWRELPPVERLPASAEPAAAGAYVMATGTIFLNPAWLEAASREAALAVLTEELGHHLDGLLNGGDAPGDEGELFAALLHGDGIISAQRRQRLRRENDHSTLLVEGQVLEVEQSNPPPPLVASLQGLRNPSDVRVVGNHAYIADYSLSTSDLKIINISRPSAPVLLSQFNGTDIISDIDFVNGYVFAADGASGLRVISVGDPSSPSLKSTYNSPGDSQDVKVVGNYAYVADGTSGLQIVNISNPNSPVLQGNAPAPDDVTGLKGVVSGVDIVGSLAYVISNRRQAGLGELQVFNVSNPAAPVKLGQSSFQLSSLDLLYNVQVVGQYAYIAAGSKGMKIVDVSNPAVPVLRGEYYYNSDQRAYDVQVVGKHAFVAYDLYGLEIIDVSNPSSPVLLSYYDPSIKIFGSPVTSTVTSVEVVNDYAYLTVRATKDLGGLWILDVNQYTQVNDSQSVTLLLSSDGVSEDEPANLVYTFSRAGSTATALTVSYTVGGSARLVPAGTDPSDYTVLGGPSGATSRTVTFAAGSATATVTIDPTADADPELDETVILSLAPGVGYTVGLQTSATGTIRNDDTTIETLGTTTLLRRGDGVAFAKVSGGPAVQITSPWGATVGSNTSPWQMLAADTVNGVNQILWRNNSANFLHTWSLDATWTWTSSGGTFALNEAPGWTLETSFQVDANNDGIIGAPLSTIEARGTTTLLRRPSDDSAFVQVGSGPRTQVQSPWGATIGSNTSPWQMLAADTINGVNQVLWRNNSANVLHTWSLDANWNWTASNGTDAPTSPQGIALLNQFGLG